MMTTPFHGPVVTTNANTISWPTTTTGVTTGPLPSFGGFNQPSSFEAQWKPSMAEGLRVSMMADGAIVLESVTGQNVRIDARLFKDLMTLIEMAQLHLLAGGDKDDAE